MPDQGFNTHAATYIPGAAPAKPELPELFPLLHLSLVLTRVTGRQAPGHRSLYAQVLDGKIPAEYFNRQWWIRGQNVPLIIERTGLADSDQPESGRAKVPQEAAG